MSQPMLARLLQQQNSGASLLHAARVCGQQYGSFARVSEPLQGFHSQEKESQPEPQQPSLLQLQHQPLGFAASGLGLGLLRPRSPLSSLRPGLMSLSTLACRTGPVLGLGHRVGPIQPTQARGYLTEGHLLGTAFMLSTDIMFWCVRVWCGHSCADVQLGIIRDHQLGQLACSASSSLPAKPWADKSYACTLLIMMRALIAPCQHALDLC